MKQFVDQNEYPQAKREANKMKKMFGVKPEVDMVDKDYAFVPNNTSQSAKGGRSNVSKAHEMNMKRFGLDR